MVTKSEGNQGFSSAKTLSTVELQTEEVELEHLYSKNTPGVFPINKFQDIVQVIPLSPLPGLQP